jgi:cobalt-zinc-cadmium efflux system membrane fusion protein
MQKIHKHIPVVLCAIAFVVAVVSTACDRKPSEKTGNEVAVQAELCARHQLPVSDCFMCDPTLRDPDRLWCQEHDRYEDRCFICHPELKDENRLWCSEHNLYEDECIFCHPELKKKQAAADMENGGSKGNGSLDAAVSIDLQCEEHGVLEKECGICHPELADALQPGQSLKIRFESAESAAKAGVGLTKPLPGRGLSDLSFLCRVTYNQNRFARITPLATGVVQRVLTDVGEIVVKGEVLVEILSPEIAKAKSEYLIALANEKLKETVFKRKKELLAEKIASQHDYELAHTEYKLAKNTTAAAYQQLLNYGFTSDEIKQIAATCSTSSTLRVLAPFSGTLIDRHAVVGETVMPGDITFTLADLSSMWLELSIPEDRIAQVAVGDSVETIFDVLPEARIRGQLTWVAAGIDEQTRMLKGRAVVPNLETKLKNGMFGQVRVVSERSITGLSVPAESLHRFGPDRAEFVFTKIADDLFEVRRVAIGAKKGDYVEILTGLMPEDQVVAAHSFTVKSEFLKARLGAGCVDE